MTSPINHFAAGSGLKSLGHWFGLQTLARDRCVSDIELPVREILFNAGHKCPSSWFFVGQLLRSCVHNRVFGLSHPWIMDILLLLGQLFVLSSSNCRLCSEIEIILCNLSLCVFTFLGGNPVFSNTDQININTSLLQVDNFVQYMITAFKIVHGLEGIATI